MFFVSLSFFGIAGIGIVGLIADGIDAVRLRRRGIGAMAEVIGVNTSYSRWGASKSRVVRFRTADGEAVKTELPTGQLRGIPVGVSVGILYLPDVPDVASAGGGRFRYVGYLFGIAFFIFLGVTCLLSH